MSKIFGIILTVTAAVIPISAPANQLADADRDMVPDRDEMAIYFTDPDNPDSDSDGYSDWLELVNGYSPHNPLPVRLEDNDQDGDGLSDRLELNFHTNLLEADSDGDGYSDGDEIAHGYDPLNDQTVRLAKRLEINTSSQELNYFLGGVRLGSFSVSSGRPGMSTPKGFFQVDGKHPRAWSANWGLWMPYWMSLEHGYFGIHELPEWPGGIKEGADHLGQPVSHGCIRLGVGPAEYIYNWSEIGTPVFIY